MSWSSIQDFLVSSDRQTIDCFHQTRWDALCQIASTHAGGLGCVALDQVAGGLNNIVRMLEFSDQSRWVVRVLIRRSSRGENLDSEVATMQFIKDNSELPVPRVFASASNRQNSANAAFILMELLPGCVAMDALGGYPVHRGEIPRDYRANFYRSVAKCHVCIACRLLQMLTTFRSR